MREIISVSLPKGLKKDIDAVVKAEGVSRSDIIRESIRDYIYFAKLRRTREKLILKAQSKGIFSEEDVFQKLK